MSAVAVHAVTRVDAITHCPGCRRREDEIEQLRRELASRQRHAEWCSRLWLGWGMVLLAVVPACGLWAFFVAADHIGDKWLIVPLYGLVLGVMFAAPGVLAVAATLHWRSLWLRGFRRGPVRAGEFRLAAQGGL